MSQQINKRVIAQPPTTLERLQNYPTPVLTVREVAENILFRTHRAVIKQILQGRIPAEKDERGWWIIKKSDYLMALEAEKEEKYNINKQNIASV